MINVSNDVRDLEIDGETLMIGRKNKLCDSKIGLFKFSEALLFYLFTKQKKHEELFVLPVAISLKNVDSKSYQPSKGGLSKYWGTPKISKALGMKK